MGNWDWPVCQRDPGELEPPTGQGELESPTGHGELPPPTGHGDQGAATDTRGRRLVLECLQELAVSPRLVTPHHCDPPQHLTYRMNGSSGCCSSLSICFFDPGGPTLGSSAQDSLPSPIGSPPPKHQKDSARTRSYFVICIIPADCRLCFCSAHSIPHSISPPAYVSEG
ncbi:hypothetical protein EYF80_065686 [Liparis tanakae]|uniref:Uncharacterized protein n=1 Tax=Liparis tanakae TaxID=230148 RepID=A0A4Z2E603_9TELE|nr:hypothetical protein EYF80_065686 [Liparis tanakae]